MMNRHSLFLGKALGRFAPMNTLALTRKDEMMKSVEQEKPTIKKILTHGLQAGLITEDEYKKGLACQTWDLLQPVLDKAQEVKSTTKEELKQAREAKPLYRSDFTVAELEKLKTLAPEEYEMLK